MSESDMTFILLHFLLGFSPEGFRVLYLFPHPILQEGGIFVGTIHTLVLHKLQNLSKLENLIKLVRTVVFLHQVFKT